MTLSQQDGQLYYRLWLPLLDFVNRKHRVNRKLKSIATAKELDPADVKEIANTLWADVRIIDDYLKENTELSDEHRDIIRSWKQSGDRVLLQKCYISQNRLFGDQRDTS